MNSPIFSDLRHLMTPRSIALVGASDRSTSIGGRALENLTKYSDFRGKLHLVNPTRSEIDGRKCVPSVSDIDETPDAAIIAVRAESVVDVLADCASRGVKFAIVFTSGFGEVGASGKAEESRMLELARASGMRIYGPNCPGLNNVNARVGMTFSPAWRIDQRAGPLGLATQGGGMGRTILQSMARGIGTGLWCSAGNEVDLEVSDFIHYMATADDIKVIATTLEGVRNGPRFLEACQHAARNGKPIVAMKIGKSEYGMKAAASHTAAITGSADVNSAVFKELGIIEVDDVDELADTAALLARRQPTGREKIAVFCYSGGTGAMAADKIGSAGLELAGFSDATVSKLGAQLPEYANISNPVDTTGVVLTNPELGYEALKNVSDDPNVGVVLYPIPFEYGEVTTAAAHSAARLQKETDKPIVMVWMSDKPGDGLPALVDGGMAPARSISNAVRAIRHYVDYGMWAKEFQGSWKPELLIERATIADNCFADLPRNGAISEYQAKAWLERCGIAVPRSIAAGSAEAAAKGFEQLGGNAVAMKIISATITHKSELGGVRLGIRSAAEAGRVYAEIMAAVAQAAPANLLDGVLLEVMQPGPFIEMVVGIQRDPVFGHVCTVGLGGVSIELFKDVSRRLLPITNERALSMICETNAARLLGGFRGNPPMDIQALSQALVNLSDLVMRVPYIEEIEINPMAVLPNGQGVVALDAVLTFSH